MFIYTCLYSHLAISITINIRSLSPFLLPSSHSVEYVGALLFIQILSPSIGGLARVQDCAPTQAGGFLLSSPEISCHDSTFMHMQLIAMIVGYIYISLPIALTLMLASPPHFQRLRRSLDFLMKQYNREKALDGVVIIWGWEFLILLRKVGV